MKFKSVKDFSNEEDFVNYYDSLSKSDQIKFLLGEFEIMILENEKVNPTVNAIKLFLLCMDVFLTQSLMASLGYDDKIKHLFISKSTDILTKEDKDDDPTWN